MVRDLGEVTSMDRNVMPCQSIEGCKYWMLAIDHGISYLVISLTSTSKDIRLDTAQEFWSKTSKVLFYTNVLNLHLIPRI
jgi:hypothetical protein